MYCTACGAYLKEEHNFCTNCGAQRPISAPGPRGSRIVPILFTAAEICLVFSDWKITSFWQLQPPGKVQEKR